jgi:hypothetical protein
LTIDVEHDPQKHSRQDHARHSQKHNAPAAAFEWRRRRIGTQRIS